MATLMSDQVIVEDQPWIITLFIIIQTMKTSSPSRTVSTCATQTMSVTHLHGKQLTKIVISTSMVLTRVLKAQPSHASVTQKKETAPKSNGSPWMTGRAVMLTSTAACMAPRVQLVSNTNTCTARPMPRSSNLAKATLTIPTSFILMRNACSHLIKMSFQSPMPNEPALALAQWI